MKRRALLGALAAATAGADEGPALDALARAKGLRIGSAIGDAVPGSRQRFAFGDAAQRALLARECSLVVCENEMKWQALRPAPGRFDFTRADAIADWATAQGLGLRGHTLLWMPAEWFPAWVGEAAASPAAAEALLLEHVRAVAGRWGRRIGSWDVVNEAVDPATGGLRTNPLAARLGALETVAAAFHAAREAAPHARLAYNDYMGWGAGSRRHRDGVLRLLAALKDRGVPVDVLGLQGHVGTDGQGRALDPAGGHEADWRRFLDEAAAMGLELAITEFDVNDRHLGADPAQRDREVAAIGRAFLDLTLDQRAVRTLVFWGLADPYSWLQAIWPRADGLPKRPLPYDEQGRPKPLRDAVVAALKAMPARSQGAR